MIISFLDKIYVDTNIPDLVLGTSGEHLTEFHTACSLGSRLNKEVVMVKPSNPLNPKVYDIIPEGVVLNFVKQNSLSGINVRVIIWIVSGFFIERFKKHIYSFFRSRVNIATSKVCNNEIKSLTCKILTSLKIHIVAQFVNKRQYINKKEISNSMNFRLSDNDIKTSQKYLDNQGVSYNKKIVCLHLRDHINDNDGYNRSCTIKSYEDGIKHLNFKGFLVIKIGRNSKEKYIDNNVIDLAFGTNVPHIVQIYLISICEFVVSYQTGVIPALSYMFNKPLLMLNVVDPILQYPIKNNALIALKTLYDKKSNKEVGFNEIISGKITSIKKNNRFDELYYYKDNTPNEILSSIKEILFFIENRFKKNDDQIFMRKYLQDQNLIVLKEKKDIGVHNFHMRWSGVDFIGAGALCAWYAKKIRYGIENYNS